MDSVDVKIKKWEYSYDISGKGETQAHNRHVFPPDSGNRTIAFKKEIKQYSSDDEREFTITVNSFNKGYNKSYEKTFVEKPDETGTKFLGKKLRRTKSGVTDLRVYPNPGKGKFHLEFEIKKKGAVTICITDMEGKQIYKEEVKWQGITQDGY